MTEIPGQKLWGQSTRAFIDAVAELVVAHVKVGGYSSRHSHKSKWNTFEVIQGELLVRTWTAPGQDNWVEKVIHSNCPAYSIEPGVVHQFEALSDVLMYEFYRAIEGEMIDPDDIHRFDEGGVRGDQPQHG